LSSIGMGTYTGPADATGDRQYTESVMEAIRRGINVIDCAINYRNMRSERAVGEGLRELFRAGEATRDEVWVMTKGGYIPFDGEVPPNPSAYLKRAYIETGILRPSDIVAGSHCIAPRYLEDQLARSLTNLRLEAVDVYFLHSVEQQLDEAPADEFYSRVAAAFRMLEGKMAEGKVGCYGVATWNGFRVPADQRGHLSLERLMTIAREVGGDGHGFRVLQLPYNLGMFEALGSATQLLEGKPVPLFEAAAAYGLAVVVSVPLLQGKVLPHVPERFAQRMPDLSTNAQRAIQFVRSTPGVLAPLVGMRQAAHVRENAEVAAIAPLSGTAFFELLRER